ncbi:MAG: phosphatase PAP2 family protein [bacterium]
MEHILDWGVNIVLWLQQYSPLLDLPFIFLTLLGEQSFFVLLLPLLYWCADRRLGIRFAVLFLLSAYFNGAAKAIAAQPRPFEYDPRVRSIFPAGGHGFPSGHAQNAVVVWGYLASSFRRPWLWAAAGLLIALIPLSRIYLGVHFPTDILGGYLMGGALLLLYLRLEPAVEARLRRSRLMLQVLAGLCLPALLILLIPAGDAYGIVVAASLMGLGAGSALEARWVRFDTGGRLSTRALRFLVGMLFLLPLGWALETACSGQGAQGFLQFLRYLALSLFAAVGMPWVFVRLGLAARLSAQNR